MDHQLGSAPGFKALGSDEQDLLAGEHPGSQDLLAGGLGNEGVAAEYGQGPPGAAPEGEAQPEVVIPHVSQVFEQSISNFYTETLIPMSKNIEHNISQLTYEAGSTSQAAGAERDHLHKELERVGGLVIAFQQSIMKILPFGMMPQFNQQ